MDRWLSVSLALISMMFVFSAFSYPSLPDTIAVHWNAEGIADGFAHKNLFTVFFVPLLALGLFLLFLLMPRIDVFKSNWEKFHEAYLQFIVVIIGFIFYIQIVAYFANMGFLLTINYLFLPGLSALFLYVANFLGKVKRNFFAGIRTPWTLANDKVWEMTHRKGVWVFRLFALVLLITLLAPSYMFAVFIVFLLLGILYLIVYSYLEYQKIGLNELETFSMKRRTRKV
jgi:uncharacterized membrane protein